MNAFATLQDIEDRYPNELTLLAANEDTGLRDDERIHLSLSDATNEMRSILFERYSSEELSKIDDESQSILKTYCIDIALYRIAISFSRVSDQITERYEKTITRMEAIAKGKGALSFLPSQNNTDDTDQPGGNSISPNEVILVAPERMFTRNRLR